MAYHCLHPAGGDGAARPPPGDEAPSLAKILAMGQALVQRCCDAVGDVGVCPGCPGAAVVARRKCLEELIVEVDDARQENQRLNKQTARLRTALREIDGRHSSKGRPLADISGAGDSHGVGVLRGRAQSSPGAASEPRDAQALDAELLRTKQLLIEVQQENVRLKEATGGWAGSQSPVTMAKYVALQQQVADLERAHETAVQQTDRMLQQQADFEGRAPRASSAAAFASPPPRLAPAAGLAGREAAERLLGSQAASGLSTPLGRTQAVSPCGGRAGGYDFGHGIGSGLFASPSAVSSAAKSRPGSMAASAAPSGAQTPSALHSLLGGTPPRQAEAEEVRRRVLAMQSENEQLRRKVRMLASVRAS